MLLALTCFVVLLLALRALSLNNLVAAIVAAGVTIALKPWLATLPIDWRLFLGLAAGVAFFLLPWWLGPIQSHADSRIAASPRFAPYDPRLHHPPDSVTTPVRAMSSSLVAAGFERMAEIVQSNFVGDTCVHVAVLEKRSTGQQALCAATYHGSDPTGPVTTWVELLTSFSDGRSLGVNNSAIGGVFALVPGKVLERFATIADPAQLAGIHARLVERVRGDASFVLRAPAQPVAESLNAAVLLEMEQQVAQGYFRLDQAASAYRATWKGAILMCWKLLPPLSVLRGIQAQRREVRLLTQLGIPNTAPVPAAPVATRPTLSWAGVAAIGVIAAYFAGGDTRPASALEAPATPSLIPADFAVPNDFPGAVRALEQLAGTRAGPLMVLDTLGARVKASGASVPVTTELADSLLAGAQQRFLEQGFFLFRHESNYGLEGRPDALALVPMWDQYRVVKVVGTSGADSATSNAGVIGWLRALAPEAPFVLTGVGSDHVAGRFTGRLADPDAMARRLHAFCPDVVDQGTGSVADLAVELRRTNAFSCWWDRAR